MKEPELTGIEIWDLGKRAAWANYRKMPLEKKTAWISDQGYAGKISTELVDRCCMKISEIVPEEFKGQVPNGVAAAREISKIQTELGRQTLLMCLKTKRIFCDMTREDVDKLYRDLGGPPPAERH